jgi:hypothetical protein
VIRSVPLARAALGNFILSLGGMCVFNSNDEVNPGNQRYWCPVLLTMRHGAQLDLRCLRWERPTGATLSR